MENFPVHLFKDSFGPFVTLLNEHQLKYQMRQNRAGIQAGPAGVLEIVQAVGSAAMWGALATVIVAFINSRRGRKVIITTKDNVIVHAEGLSMAEIEVVLQHAKNMTAIATQNEDSVRADNGGIRE